jgi:hypothetical protein
MKAASYHTNSMAYAPELRNVRHDHDTCADGKRILLQHCVSGTGNKPRCNVCIKLAERPRAARPMRPTGTAFATACAAPGHRAPYVPSGDVQAGCD